MSKHQFWNFIFEFQRTKEKAKKIKADPEKQPKSKVFGVSSIFASVLGVAFSFVIVFALRWILYEDFFKAVGGAVIGIIGLGGTLAAIYNAIERWAFQLYINKKPITWIALIIWILAIVAIALIVILLTQL